MRKSNERTVANIYKDTRKLLNDFKARYDLKSDDQAIRFLCQAFYSEKVRLLETYLKVKNGKKEDKEGGKENDE